MSALRKAGIWLGLVEEEDRHDVGEYDDEFGDDDDYSPPVRPRPVDRTSARSAALERARYEREGRTERDSRLDRDPRSDRDARLDRAPRLGESR
ncbi:MAG TPA: cell division protein SepF, partial [Micromonosporaceae bacterium]